jgi:PglZ domain
VSARVGAAARTAPWPESDLRKIAESARVLVVVLDPDELLDPSRLLAFGDVQRVTDWFELRRAYETHGRRRAASDPRLVLHVCAADFHEPTDVPFDIEQAATVVVFRAPFDRGWVPVWRELDRDRAARLVRLLAAEPNPTVSSVLGAVFDVFLPQADESQELDDVVRLRTGGNVPSSFWPSVATVVRGDLAAGLASEPVDASRLQAAWTDWLARGSACPHAQLLADSATPVLRLLHAGILRPAPRLADGVPAWTEAGAVDADAADVLSRLVDARPDPWPPTTVDEWIAAATWWGDVRSQMAVAAPVAPAVRDAAWAQWAEMDEAFRPWLQQNLGTLMASTRARPATVDKIAPFLARRHRAGSDRILLVVMDGMGLAQWSLIRRLCNLTVVDAGSAAAMIPTLTSFSRQAIFAGTPPIGFPDSILTTAREEERWRSFWVGEGVGAKDVRYINTAGTTIDDIPVFGTEKIVGIAVLAVDHLMHGADFLADAQMAAGIRAWVMHGFMTGLVERATAAGFECWVTADHGNLESLPSGKVNEGLGVDHAGRRARSYPNATLRDVAKAEGIVWDPPGLPPNAPSFIFAPDRKGYISGSPQVVHGGLSLDEVLVPFVRVTP